MTFHDFIRPFAVVYKEITLSLYAFLNEEYNNRQITRPEGDWFDALILLFKDRYERWPYAGGLIEEYLSKFHRRRVPKLLRLAGHAYLHISHDLPLAIADSLGSNKVVDRNRARTIFLRPSPRFYGVFVDSVGRRRVGGVPGLLTRLIPWRKSVLAPLAHWIIALRTTGWLHGEILHASASRGALERQLAVAINDAADEALEAFWIFGWWRLQPPTLVLWPPMVEWPLIVSQFAQQFQWLIVVLGGAALVLCWRWYCGQLARTIDLFGLLILRNTSRVMLAEVRGAEDEGLHA